MVLFNHRSKESTGSRTLLSRQPSSTREVYGYIIKGLGFAVVHEEI